MKTFQQFMEEIEKKVKKGRKLNKDTYPEHYPITLS
jgi:hypothetical protein